MDTENHPQNLTRPVGWRARIGVIVPLTNTMNEAEFNRMKPAGVTVHFARVPLHADPAADDFAALFADLDRAAGQLSAADVDVIAFGCTSSSMACPADRLLPRLEQAGGRPAITTAGAILEALGALGVSRIAMATPYIDATNEKEKAYLESHGIRVVAMAGLGLDDSAAGIQRISRVPPAEVYAHARAVDRNDAEAVLICCTDFATADVLATLEAELGKPVISSNSAGLWAALRKVAITDPIDGYGRLLGGG